MSLPLTPYERWDSGTNQNSIPANNNSLRSEIFNTNGVSDSVTAQPALTSPADDGKWYIIPAGATGTQWATFAEDSIAIFYGGTWYEFAPADGNKVTVDGVIKIFETGTGWVPVTIPAVVDPDAVNAPSNSAGTVTLDFDGKSRYIGSITLAANVTTLAFSNLPGAGKFAEYELHITEDGTGGHTFAIPASHKALGGSDTAIATSANAVTVLTASTVDNGTTWRYAMQESA